MGNSTKIHFAVDSGGLPVYFELSGGQAHAVSFAGSLKSNSPTAEVIVADKGYDSDGLRGGAIESTGTQSNIPRKANKKRGNSHIDMCLYKYRHPVENAFLRVKKN